MSCGQPLCGSHSPLIRGGRCKPRYPFHSRGPPVHVLFSRQKGEPELSVLICHLPSPCGQPRRFLLILCYRLFARAPPNLRQAHLPELRRLRLLSRIPASSGARIFS